MIKRNTKQKSAIENVFGRVDGPLSVQEILGLAQRQVPGIGVATVYRNIKLLLEEGRIKVAALPDDVLRYEAFDRWEKHHHHFQCNYCNKVFDVDICSSDFKDMVPQNFSVSRHEVMLYGCCNARACIKRSKKAKSAKPVS